MVVDATGMAVIISAAERLAGLYSSDSVRKGAAPWA